MPNIDLEICGRTYQVRCREGEEDNLRAAGRLVDTKSREVLAGLGSLSEARQFFFAALLMADQMLAADRAAAPSPGAATIDEAQLASAETLATRLETIASALEQRGQSA